MIATQSRTICLVLLSAGMLLAALSQSAVAQTPRPNLNDAFKGDQSPLHQIAGQAGYKAVSNPDEEAEKLIGQIINVVLSFLGVIFLVLMIYGGFLWMTARGNETQVTKAKDLIVAAIIGMVIVLASFAISYFILEKFSETTLE